MSKEGIKYYVNDLIVLLQYLYIWPRDHTFPMYLSLSTSAFVVISVLMCALLTVSEVIASVICFEIQIFASSIASFGFHATGFIKWVFCAWKTNEIAKLFATMDKCHAICTNAKRYEEDKEYEKSMENLRGNINAFIRIWFTILSYGVLHWCLNPLCVGLFVKYIYGLPENVTEMPQQLPYLGWHPWSIDRLDGYITAYIFQSVGSFGAALGIVAFDAIYICTLMVSVTHLRYLNFSLERIGDSSNRKMRTEFGIQRQLRIQVVHHASLMKLLNDLQALVNPVMFTQCIETLIVVCLISVEASTIKITSEMGCVLKLWSMLEYFMAACLQLYLFCFFATEIKTAGLQVADSVGFCGWEKIESDEKKLFMYAWLNVRDVQSLVGMITVRAQKPIILAGGPWYELSLKTFKDIIGMAISNAVVLRQLSETN